MKISSFQMAQLGGARRVYNHHGLLVHVHRQSRHNLAHVFSNSFKFSKKRKKNFEKKSWKVFRHHYQKS